MEETHNPEIEENKIRSKALPLFIFLFLASLALCAFLFFKYARNSTKIQSQNEELTLAYSVLNLRADSLQKELDFAHQQLQDKINENLAQTDLKDELRVQLEAKSRELSAAYSRISKEINGGGTSTSGPKNLLAAKKEITTLKEENTKYIAKVEQLQRDYDSAKALASDNETLANSYRNSNDIIDKANSVLEKKLSTASILRVAGLKVDAIRSKKGKQEVIDKANKVERIKISFSVMGSELTEKEAKDLRIRIIESSGAVLTKTNSLKDSKDLSSLEETIQYDGNEKGITFYYKQDTEYKKGAYKVEVYHEDKLLDRTTFSLR
jgi:hypothetical protein